MIIHHLGGGGNSQNCHRIWLGVIVAHSLMPYLSKLNKIIRDAYRTKNRIKHRIK